MFYLQKRHNITSVSEMKDFVAKDLKGLKQQHKSLATRKFLYKCLSSDNYLELDTWINVKN